MKGNGIMKLNVLLMGIASIGLAVVILADIMGDKSVAERTAELEWQAREIGEAQAPAEVVAKPEVKEDTRELPGEVVGTAITSANVFNGVNQLRYNSGLPILKRNAQLDAAAQAKLEDMIEQDYFAHVSPDGKNHNTFIEEAGYVQTYAGENLATDFASVQETVNAWLASPTHYANIVKARYTETGVAVSGTLVVQIFAAPR